MIAVLEQFLDGYHSCLKSAFLLVWLGFAILLVIPFEILNLPVLVSRIVLDRMKRK